MRNFRNLVLAGAASLLAFTAANARTLSPEEALSRLSGSDIPKKAAPYLKTVQNPELKLTVNTTAGEPAVYLFENTDKTMMVVGANDIAAPLLAYGLQPGEGEYPPQFKKWLEGYAMDIAAADSIIATGEAGPAPRRIKKIAGYSAIEPLLTTTWNQGNPYNYYCPEQDGKKSVTGCVATAMAQVLKFHEYPEKAKGEGHAWCNGEELTRDLDMTFQWDKMRDNYPGSVNPARATSVAELMVACGFAADMGYSPSSSGAGNGNVPRGFVNHFSYDVSVQMFSRNHYTLETWQEMLIKEMNDNGPVYYSGFSKDGGHAFVCDGFDGNNSFHFNWGWGGYCDGYFRIDDLEPSGQGIGGYEGGYNLGQVAMFNVHKPVRGSKRPDNTLIQGDDFNVSIPEGRKIRIEGFWSNDYYENREFTLAFELENIETGNKIYKTVLGPSSLQPWWGFTSLEGEMSPDYPDGTYELHVVSRTGFDKKWIRPPYNLQRTGFVYVTLRNGYPKIGMESPELKVLNAQLADNELKQNVEGKYTVELCNSFATKYNLRLAVALLDEESVMKASSKTARIIMDPDETKIYENTFKIEYPDDFDFSKEYEVVLYDDRNKEIIYSFGNYTVQTDPTAIAAVVADPENVALTWDADGHATVTATAPIASITVHTPAGTLLNVPAVLTGNTTTIDLLTLQGVVLITVTDTNGTTATIKAVR